MTSHTPTLTRVATGAEPVSKIQCIIVGPKALWQICCTENIVYIAKITISEVYGKLWAYPRSDEGQLYSLGTINGHLSSVRVQKEQIIVDFMYLAATFRGDNGYLVYRNDDLKPIVKLDCYSCQVAMNAPEEFKTSMLEDIRIESEEMKFTEEELQLLPKATMRSTDVQFVCPICTEPVKEMEVYRYLSCGDRFHMTCIDAWLRRQNTCPECGVEITVP